MIVFYVFAGLVVIRLVAIVVILLVALSTGPTCPACRGETLAIRTPWLKLAPWIERRWCLSCGWSGLLRRGQPTSAKAPMEAKRAKTA